MTRETGLVFTLIQGSARLESGETVQLAGGDPVVPSRLAAGELERLTWIGAVGARFVAPEWFTPPQLAHRQYVARAMGLSQEKAPTARDAGAVQH